MNLAGVKVKPHVKLFVEDWDVFDNSNLIGGSSIFLKK
jgi:hypothetical protein